MSSPELSLVVPLYNEEATTFRVASELVSELRSENFSFELVLVENGSMDQTGREIKRLREKIPEIRHVRVERNQGYGLGVLCGLAQASGSIVGFMAGDGQVSARDARRVVEVSRANPGSLVKARRVRRFDGPLRLVTSALFNILMRLFFGRTSRDVNGTPKLFPREWLPALKLESKDWFLDAEVLLKSISLGKNIVEVDLSFGKRESGHSHVKGAAVLEFLRNMVRFRWKRGPAWKSTRS